MKRYKTLSEIDKRTVLEENTKHSREIKELTKKLQRKKEDNEKYGVLLDQINQKVEDTNKALNTTKKENKQYKENNTLLLKEITDLKKLDTEFKNNQEKNKILKHDIEKGKLRIAEIESRRIKILEEAEMKSK